MPAPKKNKYASFNNFEKLLNGKKRDWVKDELKRYRAKRTVSLYNQFRKQNNSNKIKPDQWKMLAETYRPETKLPEVTVKQFLNNTEVKTYADAQLMAVYEELKVNIPFVVKKRIEILNKSIADKQHSAALKALEGLESGLGLNNKIKVTETRQISQNNALETNYNNALQEKQQVKIEVTQSNNDTGEDKKDAE